MKDEVVDKDKFKAAIFRRGNKQELFHQGDVLKEVTGDEKLDELLKIWSLPRSGKDFAAAIWRPEKCGAEVVLQKGKLFSHIGCLWGPKLYVTIEEAVYMVDRASMMLFQEDPKTKKKSLLSVKECFSLMASCGVSIDRFVMYSKLLRAGYIVHRGDVPWVLKGREEIAKHTLELHQEAPVPTSEPYRPTKRRRMNTVASCVSKGKSGEWWPAYTFHDASIAEHLPRCDVVNEETRARDRLARFPRMKPIQNRVYDTIDTKLLFTDVYAPNGNFSRKKTGPKAALVSMNAQGTQHPPTCEVLYASEQREEQDVPVRFVNIEHGDVAFYSFSKRHCVIFINKPES